MGLVLIWIGITVIGIISLIISIAIANSRMSLSVVSMVLLFISVIFGIALLAYTGVYNTSARYDELEDDYYKLTIQAESVIETDNKYNINIESLFEKIDDYNNEVITIQRRVDDKMYNWFYNKQVDRIKKLKTIDWQKLSKKIYTQ